MRFFALIALVALAIASAFTQNRSLSGWALSSPTPPRTASKPTPRKTGAAANSRPKTTPKKLDEKAEWEKATALTDPAAKIAALQQFNTNFPSSEKLTEATELIATTRAAMAADKAAAGDVEGAATLYKLALSEGPAKLSDNGFAANLAKAPADLYFRGLRPAALEVAKMLEEKAEGNGVQLLPLAQFYLATENGADAKRIADKIVAAAPTADAYMTVGMAARMQFAIDDAAASYAKALELDPDSVPARRGLAEMKRAQGKPDEAAKLFREILEKDDSNIPARTGLVMTTFEGGKLADAEAALAKELEVNPSNVILLASAAYWYAANGAGDKAVDLAQKAIDADPRFIWSHIALARGLALQGKPAEAEKALLRAQRYGNFPTLQYELASAKFALGYYREAAEQLSGSFSVVDGEVRTNLGGRVERNAKNFTQLLEDERRASIFAPTAADTSANSGQLSALMAFQQELDSKEINGERLARAADELVKGDDRFKTYRQVYVAGAMVDKGAAFAKALEIAKQATAGVDTALELPNAATLVLASELYDSRHAAIVKGEYIRVPDVPRTTLSAILRGRIEELQGWSMLQMGDKEGGLIRLRRAVGVLPEKSSYWREAHWRLGSALALNGKETEALDAYIKSYKDGPPNGFRYSVIESLYKRLNGNLDGLVERIGPNPSPIETVAKVEPSPSPESTQPSSTPDASTSASPSPSPETAASLSPTPTPEMTASVSPTPTPEAAVSASPTPTPEAAASASPTPTPEAAVSASPTPTPETGALISTSATRDVVQTKAEATPELKKSDPASSPTPGVSAENPVAAASPSPSPTDPTETISAKTEATPSPSPSPTAKDLFPPVVITVPSSSDRTSEKPAKTEIKPCTLTASEESLTLQNGGGDLAVIIGTDDDR
ncbi:MAG: tetratricopeptide repeat protein, partial [Acidobacteria bacterium]|nr:tetratricopeptide repeat protein [Acidobacteriota bacterium]